MSTEQTVVMVVSQEAYNDDEEMRDLVELALKDDRVRVIYAPQGELEHMINVMRMNDEHNDSVG